MNMMSVLLGATGLLLVAALILSIGSMNSGSDAKEIAELRAQLAEIKAAEREVALLGHSPTPITTAVTPDPTTFAPDAVEEANRQAEDAARIKALEAELAEATDDAEDIAKKADILEQEQVLLTQRDVEKTDKEGRRARIIQEALLIATVTGYSPEDGFAVLNIQRPDNAQEGTKLAVRRNLGIVGQLQISKLYPNSEAIADPLPGTFPGGSIDIKPGDELIIPPL